MLREGCQELRVTDVRWPGAYNSPSTRLKRTEVTMKRIALFILACIWGALLAVAESKAQSVFEIRLVAEAAAEDTERMVFEAPMGEVLHVHKAVLLDQTAIASAAVEKYEIRPGDPEIHLSIRFSESGSKRLAEVTGQHRNERLAFLIDGAVVMAPVILTPIYDGNVMISGRYSEQEVTALANKINAALKR